MSCEDSLLNYPTTEAVDPDGSVRTQVEFTYPEFSCNATFVTIKAPNLASQQLVDSMTEEPALSPESLALVDSSMTATSPLTERSNGTAY